MKPDALRRWSGMWPVAGVLVSLVVALAGCGGSDSADPTPKVPTGLLSAEQVGKVHGDAVIDPKLFVPTLCGPDNARLWEGSKGRVVRYARPDATVTVGTWVSRDISSVGLDELKGRIGDIACVKGSTNPPLTRWQTSPMTGLPSGFVGFTTTVTGKVTESTTGTRKYTRAYGIQGDTFVMVWVDGRTDKTPPASLAARLVTRQLAEL